MRKIIAITHVTIDGVMQAPGGPEEDPSNGFTHGGWAMKFGDEVLRRVLLETMHDEFDLLLGRRTYDIWATYWPNNGANPIGKAFNRATKYVVTHRDHGLTWTHSQRIGGDIVTEIDRLKASTGPALHLWGSSEVVQALTAAALIDEHRLWVAPIVLGGGKRLFAAGAPPRTFALIDSIRTTTGVMLNTYRPAKTP